MARKISFDNLPAAVEKILALLASGESGHTALPELVQRIALLEKKIDHLERSLSPNRPVVDMQTVCKVLKLRPKAVSDLAAAGILPSHAEGRKTVFYEDDVVRFHMHQGWKTAVAEAVTKSAPAESEPAEAAAKSVPRSAKGRQPKPAPEIPAEGRHRVDVNAASVILDRTTGAIRQLLSGKRLACHKEGRKVFFYTDELREWAKNHPPLKRKPKS